MPAIMSKHDIIPDIKNITFVGKYSKAIPLVTDDKIFPKLKEFSEVTKESSYDILNILNLYDFVELSIECLIKNNLFVFIKKEELGIICEIFGRCLTILEETSSYLNKLQTYVPLRIDNSIIYMNLEF